MMEITILYFDGCPSWQTALENVRKAIDILGLKAEVNLIKINTNEQAVNERFTGSPSIRINGVDLWPDERSDYSLSCRIYQTPNGIKGSPTVEMICERIQEVMPPTK